jgi:signal transduction histidine kinase
MNQEKVFCLFQTVEDLETFYLSELAQSDIYRCLLIFKDKRKKNLSFYKSLEGRYQIKYFELSSMERKSQNIDFLEPQLAELKRLPHNSHSFIHLYIDFSLINLSPSKINTIIEMIEEQLTNHTYHYTLFSVFIEKNIKNQYVQQIVLNYPYLSLSPSQISPNFYYDENDLRKKFPSKLREIYLPIDILIQSVKGESLEIDRLEKKLFQLETQKNILESTLEVYLSREKDIEKTTAVPADLISLMEYHSLRQKYKQKAQILSTVIHDLKSPLASIQGYTEILMHGLSGPITSEMKKQLESIISNTQRLIRMVDSLLEYERYSESSYMAQRETFDLVTLLEETKMSVLPQMIQRGQKINIYSPESIELVANRELLARSIQNILDNAINYSPIEKGLIEVYAEETTIKRRKHVKLTIKDNGFGFRKSDLGKVFQPFSRFEPHSKSTGLGLSITRKIIEEVHKGTISLSSPGRNKGTTVKILIPKT